MIMIKDTLSSNNQVLLGILAILLLTSLIPSALAGLQQPPVILYGSIGTASGDLVTGGELRFSFTKLGTPQVTSVTAQIKRFEEDINFLAIVPVELTPASNPLIGLELDQQYVPQVFYNNREIFPVLLSNPFSVPAIRAIGPLDYRFSPEEPLLALSESIQYGLVPAGSFQDRQFTVRNIGSGVLLGTAALRNKTVFRTTVNGFSQNSVNLEIPAGGSALVNVRFWPILSDQDYSDILEVRTNGGSEDRNVFGNSRVPTQTPTSTPTATPDPSQLTPTPTPIESFDSDGNGIVNAVDLIHTLENMKGGTWPGRELLNFASHWQFP